MSVRIQTPLFGEIEIEQSQIITFEQGLPGFEEEHQFVLLPLEDSLFMIMQSVASELHFVLVNSFQIFPDYDFDISPGDVELLGVTKEEDVLAYNIVVLHKEFARSTANLQAPVVINTHTRKGKQIVLNRYQVKQPLFPQGAHATQR